MKLLRHILDREIAEGATRIYLAIAAVIIAITKLWGTWINITLAIITVTTNTRIAGWRGAG